MGQPRLRASCTLHVIATCWRTSSRRSEQTQPLFRRQWIVDLKRCALCSQSSGLTCAIEITELSEALVRSLTVREGSSSSISGYYRPTRFLAEVRVFLNLASKIPFRCFPSLIVRLG